tara:strand:+ start:7876 stop:9480 length:1605 start_codon:yes stop_codon:yes gene_type:complete
MVFDGTVKSDFLKFIPSELQNKDRLIDFSASDFITLRQSLIDYTKANFPLDYNNFDESDFGMLLIELMAAVGHIQSHKSDYLANENFLRTARERSSVKKLMELIGIRMKGPISAAANASLSFEATDSGASSLTLDPSQRVITVTSPQDGGSLTYTIYKVNFNGSIDLESNTESLEFVFDATTNPVITSAILLEGALVVETGTFTGPDSIKSIRLSQSPFVEKSAQVFIDGNETTNGVYLEEDNIYFASGPTDKVFQVLTDDNFGATLIFGDNTIGQAPAAGDSYTVTYRVGGGSRGNISESFINAQINGTARIANEFATPVQATVTVENTSQGTGGAEAESIAKVKRYAPLKFRSQNRLVTLNDYRAFTNTFTSNYGSTGKATVATQKAFASVNNIQVYVLEKASNTQLRQATQEFKRQLIEEINEQKMVTDSPVIVDGLIRTIPSLNLTIKLDRKFKGQKNVLIARANSIILDYFNVDNLEFGQSFSPSDLIRELLEEPQIRFATVDNISNNIDIEFNEIIQLNNFTVTAELI